MKYLKSPHNVVFVKIMDNFTLLVTDESIDFDEHDGIKHEENLYKSINMNYKDSTREEFDEMYKKTRKQLNKLSAL